MKYGVRKPNLKKSIKARTTGKVKRQVKKAVNPLYGKKGMGIVNDPKKAAYNAVYNRTTVGVSDIAKGLTAANGNPAASSSSNAPQKKEYSPNTYSVCGILMIVLGVFLALIGILLLFAVPVGGLHPTRDCPSTHIFKTLSEKTNAVYLTRCRLQRRTEKCFPESLETCTTDMTSYSRMVIPATAGRKRMSGHVSLNTAKKRAIEPPFFSCQKCLAQDFKSIAQDTCFRVSYLCVTC